MKQMYVEEKVYRERERSFVLKKRKEKASRLREIAYHKSQGV